MDSFKEEVSDCRTYSLIFMWKTLATLRKLTWDGAPSSQTDKRSTLAQE